MSPPPEEPGQAALVFAAAAFYGLMAALGWGLIAAQGLGLSGVVFGGEGADTLRDTGLGAAAGLGIVLLSWLARDLGPVRRLNRELAGVLGHPSTGAIAVLAVTSAIGEELFFRGALQPLIGFWPTVLIFGLAHGGTSQKLRTWALFATAAGALLGWLTELTGNLLAPVLCHLTVNYFNLHAMTSGGDDPGAPA